MTKAIEDLCYSIPGESIYGELTQGTLRSCTKTIPVGDIVLCDLGSGSCRTLLILARSLNATRSVGIECCLARHKIALAVIHDSGQENVFSVHKNILEMPGLPSGTTHVFSFDKAFPVDVIDAMRGLILRSESVRCVMTTKKSLLNLHDNWQLAQTVHGRLRGSGSGCAVYTFTR